MTYLLIYLAIGTVYSIVEHCLSDSKGNHEMITKLYNESEAVNEKWSYKKFYYISWITGFFIGMLGWPIMILIHLIRFI